MILVTYLALSTLCPGWLVVDIDASVKQVFLGPTKAEIYEQAVESRNKEVVLTLDKYFDWWN